MILCKLAHFPFLYKPTKIASLLAEEVIFDMTY